MSHHPRSCMRAQRRDGFSVVGATPQFGNAGFESHHLHGSSLRQPRRKNCYGVPSTADTLSKICPSVTLLAVTPRTALHGGATAGAVGPAKQKNSFSLLRNLKTGAGRRCPNRPNNEISGTLNRRSWPTMPDESRRSGHRWLQKQNYSQCSTPPASIRATVSKHESEPTGSLILRDRSARPARWATPKTCSLLATSLKSSNDFRLSCVALNVVRMMTAPLTPYWLTPSCQKGTRSFHSGHSRWTARLSICSSSSLGS